MVLATAFDRMRDGDLYGAEDAEAADLAGGEAAALNNCDWGLTWMLPLLPVIPTWRMDRLNHHSPDVLLYPGAGGSQELLRK